MLQGSQPVYGAASGVSTSRLAEGDFASRFRVVPTIHASQSASSSSSIGEDQYPESVPQMAMERSKRKTLFPRPSRQCTPSSTPTQHLQSAQNHTFGKRLSPASSTSSVKRRRLANVAEHALGLVESATLSHAYGTRSKDKANYQANKQQGNRQLRDRTLPTKPQSPTSEQLLRRETRKVKPIKYGRKAGLKIASNTVTAEDCLLVAIDYGTTFTSVSFFKFSKEDKDKVVYPADVSTISNWPDDHPNAHSLQLPSELYYSSAPVTRRLDTGTLEPAPLVDISDSESESDPDFEAKSDSDPDFEAESGSDLDSEAPRIDSSHLSMTSRVHLRDSTGNSSRTNGKQSEDTWWGFQCPSQLTEHTSRDPMGHIQRAKLGLLETEYTREGRKQLAPVVEGLVNKGTVRAYGGSKSNVQDLVADFLTPVLRHTKEQLTELGVYTTETEVHYAVTVPVLYPQQSRVVYQWALEEAVRITDSTLR